MSFGCGVCVCVVLVGPRVRTPAPHMLRRLTCRLLSSSGREAGPSFRPKRQEARIERVLSEALSSGQSAYWHGPRIFVHGVEMTSNLRVAKVYCEPADDMSGVPGGEERLKSKLERRRGFLSRLVNSHLQQKKAARIDFVWASESPAARTDTKAPQAPSGFQRRLSAAFDQLQAEADRADHDQEKVVVDQSSTVRDQVEVRPTEKL